MNFNFVLFVILYVANVSGDQIKQKEFLTGLLRIRTRTQFINDILHGIHPESPINRDFWVKRGYLKPLEEIKPPLNMLPTKGIEIIKPQEIAAASTIKRRKSTRFSVPTKRVPKLLNHQTFTTAPLMTKIASASARRQSIQLPQPGPFPIFSPFSPHTQDFSFPIPQCNKPRFQPIIYLIPIIHVPQETKLESTGKLSSISVPFTIVHTQPLVDKKEKLHESTNDAKIISAGSNHPVEHETMTDERFRIEEQPVSQFEEEKIHDTQTEEPELVKTTEISTVSI